MLSLVHAAFVRALTHVAGEPPPSLDEFLRSFAPRRLDKGTTWLEASTVPTTVAFVERGLLRLYYRRDDGREVNKSFVGENDFCGDLEALLEGTPSRLSIETLEPTTLLVADYAAVCSFYDRDAYWERFGRRLAERLYVKKARKEAALLLDSPAERYEAFVREHTDLESRVPGYHVASYLGVTPETLSRIRRSRAER